jgi:hypothetical protein
MSAIRRIAREIRYFLWIANGRIGWRAGSDIQQKATILITYYNPARMKHLDPQVRNILKCGFVDRVIISNHNPDFQIEQMTKLRDERLIFINQDQRRGCGFRWVIAAEFDPEYLIIIDDDILLFPFQLAKLFRHLVSEPEVPHGLSGMRRQERDGFAYYEKKNMKVDYLCEVYAVTRQNLGKYGELEQAIAQDIHLARLVESSMDFMLISQTGLDKPKIHNVGRIFRCPTFDQPEVAVHKANEFEENMMMICEAFNAYDLPVQNLVMDSIPAENLN